MYKKLAHDLKIKLQYEAQEEEMEIATSNAKLLGWRINYWKSEARYQQVARLQEVARNVKLDDALATAKTMCQSVQQELVVSQSNEEHAKNEAKDDQERRLQAETVLDWVMKAQDRELLQENLTLKTENEELKKKLDGMS